MIYDPLASLAVKAIRSPVRPGVRQSEQDEKLGRTPHVSRLVALAIKFQSLVSSGTVRHYRELAEFGHVSRPRLSQIMKLAHLAPGIQEKLLFLPPTFEGPDRVFERHLRFLASVVDWEKQKELFLSRLWGVPTNVACVIASRNRHVCSAWLIAQVLAHPKHLNRSAGLRVDRPEILMLNVSSPEHEGALRLWFETVTLDISPDEFQASSTANRATHESTTGQSVSPLNSSTGPP